MKGMYATTYQRRRYAYERPNKGKQFFKMLLIGLIVYGILKWAGIGTVKGVAIPSLAHPELLEGVDYNSEIFYIKGSNEIESEPQIEAGPSISDELIRKSIKKELILILEELIVYLSETP